VASAVPAKLLKDRYGRRMEVAVFETPLARQNGKIINPPTT
jgi:hypothetical protein